MNPHNGDQVRWEAWSHDRLYAEVHDTPVGARPLAATISMWDQTIGDLREIRSSYTIALDALLADVRGAAERLHDDKAPIAGLLTEAANRADTAQRQHIAFLQLNERLRVELPEPGTPQAPTWQFTSHDGWMLPPDFDAHARNTHNNEELARDYARRYEQDVEFDRLTHEVGHTASTSGNGDTNASDHTVGVHQSLAESQTIPVRRSVIHSAPSAPPDAALSAAPMSMQLPVPPAPTSRGRHVTYGFQGDDATRTQPMHIPACHLEPPPPAEEKRRSNRSIFEPDEEPPPAVIGG